MHLWYLGWKGQIATERPGKSNTCLSHYLQQCFLQIHIYYQTHKQSPLCRLYFGHFKGPLEACAHCCSTFLQSSHLQENPLHHLAH